MLFVCNATLVFSVAIQPQIVSLVMPSGVIMCYVIYNASTVISSVLLIILCTTRRSRDLANCDIVLCIIEWICHYTLL